LNLRQLRLHFGLHAETLAKRLHITPRSVAGNEAAPLRNLPLGVVLDHCKAIGADVGLFMIRTDGTREPIQ
jgi:hypothetical protein